MKNFIYIVFVFISLLSCANSKSTNEKQFSKNEKKATNDTIRIANEELEYEVIVIDPGFNSWLFSYARPRNYYGQNYLEARNRDWVIGWNNQFYQGSRLIDMAIDYNRNINYGYEVNYMLFNYLTYFQLTNKIKLGSFAPRI